MKKLSMILALVLGLSVSSFAQETLFDSDNMFAGQGLFGRGEKLSEEDLRGGTPNLPGHGEPGNGDADGPIGSGVAVLLGLGAAYAFTKKREEK